MQGFARASSGMNSIIDMLSKPARALLASFGLCALLAAPSYAANITGRVTGSDGTTPLDRVWVAVYRWNNAGSCWNSLKSVQTDANGDYDIGGLSAGTYRVGFADSFTGVYTNFYNSAQTVDEATDIIVAEGETISGINASQAGASRITGRVTGSDGITPLGGIRVTAYWDVHVNG